MSAPSSVQFTPKPSPQRAAGQACHEPSWRPPSGEARRRFDRYEQGRNAPPPEVAEKIAEVLGIPVGDLYIQVGSGLQVAIAWSPFPGPIRGRLGNLLFGGHR